MYDTDALVSTEKVEETNASDRQYRVELLVLNWFMSDVSQVIECSKYLR